MQLEDMLAYKVAMLASDLSESLSKEYASYQLSMPQWRILATLGALHENSPHSALTQKTSLLRHVLIKYKFHEHLSV